RRDRIRAFASRRRSAAPSARNVRPRAAVGNNRKLSSQVLAPQVRAARRRARLPPARTRCSAAARSRRSVRPQNYCRRNSAYRRPARRPPPRRRRIPEERAPGLAPAELTMAAGEPARHEWNGASHLILADRSPRKIAASVHPRESAALNLLLSRGSSPPWRSCQGNFAKPRPLNEVRQQAGERSCARGRFPFLVPSLYRSPFLRLRTPG